jgi:hypothetical protein
MRLRIWVYPEKAILFYCYSIQVLLIIWIAWLFYLKRQLQSESDIWQVRLSNGLFGQNRTRYRYPIPGLRISDLIEKPFCLDIDIFQLSGVRISVFDCIQIIPEVCLPCGNYLYSQHPKSGPSGIKMVLFGQNFGQVFKWPPLCFLPFENRTFFSLA